MLTLPAAFPEYINQKIHQFLLTELFDDFDEELFYEGLSAYFPKHLVREQKEKCAKVLEDLYYWSGDEFSHKLSPFHQVGLYNFLKSMEDLQNDEPELYNIYFDEADEKEVRTLWGELNLEDWSEVFTTIDEFRAYLHDAGNILEECFEDIDFVTFPYLLGSTTDKDESTVSWGLVDFYSDLLPEDIRNEYASLRKDTQKSLTLLENMDEALKVISHGVEYRGWHKIFWNGNTPKSETEVHACLDALFDAHFRKMRIGVSREVDAGTGKIDFTLYSSPIEKILVEVKLGHNQKLKQGIKSQLVHYLKAFKCTSAYYLIVCFTDEALARAKNIKAELPPIENQAIKVIILDVTRKKSGSKL